MMLDTFDGKIWYPRFYDMDTICSYNNSGQIKYDVDIEMAQGYWNTSASRLWTKIRDNFHNELVAMYAKMRANGLSYESLMSYFYGQQISKIPETYYNKDADTKYLPFADQYMGMAHGNGYEHLKRWLKNRLIFTDTLYDYAPSYNNDVLTIRANTTEPMTITIETYTPVYQHLSWYNNQMDKKKIDGKIAVTFTGTAQTATDQEVLIYGGSNIKRITGISSMNPNSMLIGSATRLIELDVSNCPILATVNATGSNFTPHTYLNKLDISNCPNLTGTLRINNSPLLRELNAKGTGIDTLQLAPSLRNLEVLRLPNTVTELTLNDAGLLNTLEFDEGGNLQRISLSNCPGIANSNVDLTKVPTVSLDNSLDKEEICLSEVTDLTLKNMPTLKRLIFTPNNEYEEFDINNVINGKNYKVTTFNNPNMKEFITTAPHRLSYHNGEYGNITPNTVFTANTLDLSDTQFTDIKFLCTTDLYNLKVPTAMKNFYCDSAMDIDTEVVTEASYEVIHDELIEQYTTDYNSNVYRFTKKTNILSNWGVYGDIIWDKKVAWGVETSVNSWVKTDYLSTVQGSKIKINMTFGNTSNSGWAYLSFYDKDKGYIGGHEIIPSESRDFSGTYTAPTDSLYYIVSYRSDVTKYCCIIYNEPYTPNIIPSSASGSLIFNLYSNNTTQPTSTSPYMWDLTGLKLNDFYTFGMNNWVKPDKLINVYYGEPLIRYHGRTTANNSEAGGILDSNTSLRMFVVKADFLFSDSNPKAITINSYGNSGYGNVIRSSFQNGYSFNLSTDSPTTTYNNVSPSDCLVVTLDKDVEYFDIDNYRFYSKDFINIKKTEALSSSDCNILTNSTFTSILDNITSITMPQRLPGYSIRMVNADITPNNYANHLYPLLVDTTLPITGKLDYSKYKGTSLAWAYAYTTNDVAITPLDSRHIGQITNEYNKLYGTDFVDIVDVWAYKDDDFSNKSTNEAITKAYIELTQDNYKTRIDEVLQWYPNCTDVYLFEDGSVTKLTTMCGANNNAHGVRGQIVHATFMEGYFENLTSLHDGFAYCAKLETVTNIPKSVTTFRSIFDGCSKLNQQFDLSDFNIEKDGLMNAFSNCKLLTHPPILPSNYTGSMASCFQGCTSLVEAPVIPDGVNALNNTFKGCTSLTTIGNIPSGCSIYGAMCEGCTSLTSVPTDGWNGAMNHCFFNCTSLSQQINISSATNLQQTFQNCSSLSITPTLPTSANCSMAQCFQSCTSLVTPPVIPQGVTNMDSCYNSCSNLTGKAIVPNSVTTFSNCFKDCSKLNSITFPLDSIGTGLSYDETLKGCNSLTDIEWTGLRTTNFSLLALYAPPFTQADVKELVNDHLGTVESATLTLGETYLAYLTEEEKASAVSKGWTLQ